MKRLGLLVLLLLVSGCSSAGLDKSLGLPGECGDNSSTLTTRPANEWGFSALECGLSRVSPAPPPPLRFLWDQRAAPRH